MGVEAVHLVVVATQMLEVRPEDYMVREVAVVDKALLMAHPEEPEHKV